MVGEWRGTQLQEIAAESDRAFAMGPFGSNIKAENYRETGVPVIRGTNLGERGAARFIPYDFVFLTKDKADALGSSSALPNDIVFVAQGTVGKVGIIPTNTPYQRFILSQNLMKVTVNPEVADPLFVFYFYRSSFGQHEIMSRVNPTGVPCISKPLTSLRQFGVRLPSDINAQRAIAHILGALDDKIDLNQRMNETLEVMAQMIFKDWFVDFGPTRAKAEGLPPYLAPELWPLFPDALDNEDKPVGWRVGRLGDVAEGLTRTIDPGDVAPDTPYIGLEHMPRRSIALESWEGAGKVTSGKLKFLSGEFLFGKLRPYFHKVGIAPIDGICSTDIVVCKPRENTAHGFVLAHISSDEFVAYTDRTSSGTKMPRTSWSLMARYEITIPPDPILEAFNSIVTPLAERLIANIHESRTLAELRDMLLPKLMSGEIRLQETEKLVGVGV